MEPQKLEAAVSDDVSRQQLHELEERLRTSEAQLRERTEALYTLQRQYSSEHFELAESMRNLKIERMRNAGAYAAQDVIVDRYQRLQARIEELKRRLRQHEAVEDQHEDTAPVVIED
ncbi:MAG: hypothetical protein ACRENA_14180 [Vulcanimicrobiaceae bacterium]